MSCRRRFFRIDGQATEKIGRKVDAFLAGETGNVRAPVPGDFIALLPVIDRLTIYFLTEHLGQASGDDSSVAQFFDEFDGVHDAQMFGQISRHVKANKPHDLPDRPTHNLPMEHEASATRDPYAIKCGHRLRIVRLALGHPVLRRFAEITGEHENNLSAWENGKRIVPTSYIQKLRELFGVSHDWIYGGDPSTMRADLSLEVNRMISALDEE